MVRYLFTNNAASALNGGITDSATSLTVDDGSAFPASDFKVYINTEVILVGSRSGNVMSSLTRGHDGTTAAAHSDNDAVDLVATAEDYQTRLIGYPLTAPAAGDDDKVLAYDHAGLQFVYAPVVTRLGEVDLASDTASISFSSIPSTFRMLYIVGQIFSDLAAATSDNVEVNVGNGTVDTGANYDYASFWRGDTDDEDGSAGQTTFRVRAGCPAGGIGAGKFTLFQCRIYNYASTDEFRPIQGEGGAIDSTTKYRQAFANGVWKNSADAIDIVTIAPGAGANWKAGSKLTLYGYP